jgi:hypothetical protein
VVKGYIYVGEIDGCRTAKPYDSVGLFYFVCVRLMPQNCRNLHYFRHVVCACSLSNVLFFHNGSNQSFAFIRVHVLPVGGMVLYNVVRLMMVKQNFWLYEVITVSWIWLVVCLCVRIFSVPYSVINLFDVRKIGRNIFWKDETVSNSYGSAYSQVYEFMPKTLS